MSAYATARPGRSSLVVPIDPSDALRAAAPPRSGERNLQPKPAEARPVIDDVLDALIGHIADRVASALAAQLAQARPDDQGDWLDSRRAADYLGVHGDTLRKLAAERTIPAEQEGRGCKLFFRRGDLDEWRRRGGRAEALSSLLNRRLGAHHGS